MSAIQAAGRLPQSGCSSSGTARALRLLPLPRKSPPAAYIVVLSAHDALDSQQYDPIRGEGGTRHSEPRRGPDHWGASEDREDTGDRE